MRGLIDDIVATQSYSTDGKKRRSLKQAPLQEEYDLRMEKLTRLRNDLAIETDTAHKFKLRKQIQYEEAELEELGQQLDQIG